MTKKGVALNLGGAVYDPTDPVGRLLFNVLGTVAEFEADLIRARTREGMAIAKAAGKLRGRKPKLTASQEKQLVQLHRTGTHTTSKIDELFDVAWSTVIVQSSGRGSHGVHSARGVWVGKEAVGSTSVVVGRG